MDENVKKQTNNLMSIRKNKKIKVVDIVDCLDITQQYYYDLERGDKRINEDIINKLADFYGVTTDYLLGRTNNMQAVVLVGDSLPEELRGFVEEIEVLKDAVNKGLSKDDIQLALEYAKKLKGIK